MNMMKKSIRRALFFDKKKLLIMVVSLVVLSIFSPLKSFIAEWLIDSSSQADVIFYLFIGLAVVLLSHCFEFIAKWSFNKSVTNSIQNIRDEISNKILNMELNKINSLSLDKVEGMYTNDLRLIEEDYFGAIFNVAMWGGMGLFAIVYMAYISPILLIVSLPMAVLPFLAPRIFTKVLSSSKKEYSISYNKLCSKTSEALRGLEAMITCNNGSFGLARIKKYGIDNIKKDYAMKQTMNKSSIATSLLAWIPGFVLLVIGALLVVEGKISVGYLITAHSLLNFIILPFRQVATSFISIKSTQEIIKQIDGFLHTEDETLVQHILNSPTRINASTLRFSYHDNLEVLHNISLKVSQGEKIAIVGASGSGKSTLIKLLCGFYSSYTGSIEINGIEMREMRSTDVFSKISYIQQEPFIFEDTIKNNISLSHECDDAEIYKLLKKVNLYEDVIALPDGINTKLSDNGDNISGGQKKRIAIARALFMKCDVLLVDEVTSSLDINTTNSIVSMLLALPCSVILVTHDLYPSYLNDFNHIICMVDGAITEEGTYSQLMSSNGYLSHLLVSMNGK